MRISWCRSCRAPILWMLNEANRSVPVDVESCGLEDEIAALPEDTRYDPAVHANHFITCPDRDKWRKKKQTA